MGMRHGDEAVGDRGERHAVDLAAEAIAVEHDVAERQRAGPVAGTPSAAPISRLASAVSASGTGTACEPRQPQHRQHVGQRAARAALVLGHGDQRQAHLLDRLPEDRPAIRPSRHR
jgi:hypothetical protein